MKCEKCGQEVVQKKKEQECRGCKKKAKMIFKCPECVGGYCSRCINSQHFDGNTGDWKPKPHGEPKELGWWEKQDLELET